MKRILLQLFFITFCFVSINAQTQKGQDIDGEATSEEAGRAICMPDANTIAVGAPGYNTTGTSNDGVVRVYYWDGNSWIQKGQDIYGLGGSFYGTTISMPDANTIGIISPPGIARIYFWDGTNWIQKGEGIDDTDNDFGARIVSMPSPNTIAISDNYFYVNANFTGQVRIFDWNGSTWVQKGNSIDGEAEDDQSGYSISMPDSITIAIGAIENDGNGSNSGQVRIYSWDGNSWIQKGDDIYGESVGDESGYSVSMPDANTVAIGARLNNVNGNFSGHVRVYEWTGTAWIQKGLDIDGNSGEVFGRCVSMANANTLAVGGVQKIRVYLWNGITWQQKGADIGGETISDDWGFSVSMPDDFTVAAGGPLNDGNGNSSGHVRVFSLNDLLSLDENPLGQLNIYPNPTSAVLNIKTLNSDIKTISIYNICGQKIAEQTFSNQINIEQLLDGIYILELKSENYVLRKRFVKTNY